MKLIACSNCHTQYDVAQMAPDSTFDCRCGESLQVLDLKGEDTPVQRCSACGALAREEDESCDYCGAAVVHIGQRGSLICPECLASNADDARFCLACGIGFEPEPVHFEKSELKCPCCDRFMACRSVAGIEIQECQKCSGLWTPEDRFSVLVDRAAGLARERTLAGESVSPRVDGGNPVLGKVEYRRCPQCDALMGRRNFRKRSGVIIDECPAHGTWLDAHELERIAGFVLSGRAADATLAAAGERSERDRAAAGAALQRMAMRSETLSERPSDFWTGLGGTTVTTAVDLFRMILTR